MLDDTRHAFIEHMRQTYDAGAHCALTDETYLKAIATEVALFVRKTAKMRLELHCRKGTWDTVNAGEYLVEGVFEGVIDAPAFAYLRELVIEELYDARS